MEREEFIDKLYNALLEKPFKEIISLDDILSFINDFSFKDIDENVVREVVSGNIAFWKEHFLKNKGKIKDFFDNDTIASLKRNIIENKPEFSKDTVRRMIDNEAIKELFTEIIYKAIWEFNKTINPFSSAMSFLGIDEQIKSFIRIFMPSVIGIATDFIVENVNSKLFEDFVDAGVDTIFEEDISFFIDKIDEDKISNFFIALIKSDTFENAFKESFKSYVSDLYNRFSNYNLSYFLGKNEEAFKKLFYRAMNNLI